MVATFQELNQKMSTVKHTAKLLSHQVPKLSQEESNKSHVLSTPQVSEVNSLITLKLPIELKLLPKLLVLIEETLASQRYVLFLFFATDHFLLSLANCTNCYPRFLWILSPIIYNWRIIKKSVSVRRLQINARQSRRCTITTNNGWSCICFLWTRTSKTR